MEHISDVQQTHTMVLVHTELLTPTIKYPVFYVCGVHFIVKVRDFLQKKSYNIGCLDIQS